NLENEYDSIRLKRSEASVTDLVLSYLNIELLKITKKKYRDLKSFCEGNTPVVRLPEYQQFFLSLAHYDED
ncbi:hypothetical protein HHI36_008457, partial [Cryptolaemus montrouzieri]